MGFSISRSLYSNTLFGVSLHPYNIIYLLLKDANKIEIDQLQCVICRVLGNYDRITHDALEKQNRNGKNTSNLILVTNIHQQARASQ